MSSSITGPERWDLIIIGAGPAGLSAAINARARNLRVLVLEQRSLLWKVRGLPWINNYLGIPDVSGAGIASQFEKHFNSSGAVFRIGRVQRIYPAERVLTVATEFEMLEAYAVLIAVGVIRAALIPGEERLIGHGVSYCTQCDGKLYQGKRVAILGYSSEAVDEANLLVGIASEIYYFHLHAGEPRGLHPSITVIRGTPTELEGDRLLQGIRIDDSWVPVEGAFIIRDVLPPSALADGLAVDQIHIRVDDRMRTNLPGIYAAGDCTGLPYQIAKAVGQGLIAAMDAARRISRARMAHEP